MLTADDVLNTKFAATKFRDGYAQDAVDDFLDRVVTTLRAAQTGVPAADPVTAADVAAVRFEATRFREGYDMEQVDALLDQVRDTLRHGPAVSDAPAAPSTVDAPPPPPPAATPGLIEPSRGWLQRLLGR
ncbi:DivIVA domain-containing protein [Cellulomonas avistercoris]|uniref:DivIVA domain-containing protein n=1 Tax=Cellulomonas avistercoris TaxID=2762242 RepID=UPI00296A9036|nr:DivIVA domain-containing protein [Cellulomonas avistercoris]